MNKPERLDLETADITSENIAKIGALFPNCLTEAKDENGRTVAAIDFDKLRQELSHDIVEGADERYRFDWPEKRKATILANTPTRMTLRPCREESVDFDTTQNLYIEGDNLEVLKLLRETYFGKVKMIYIDPPYNTGKEFVYNDDFAEGSAEWKMLYERDEEGNKLDVNTESNGRFHTDWLNMMYPRLKLAKDLLSDDGVIFISIDDNEVENLRKLCDEIFGEGNFISSIIAVNNPRGRQSDNFVASTHEYLLCYAKWSSDCTVNGEPLTDAQKADYKFSDAHGRYRLLGLRQRGAASLREDRPDMFFPIYVNPETQVISLDAHTGWSVVIPKKSDGREGRWMWGKAKCRSESNRLVAQMIERRNEFDIFVKDYLERDGETRTRKFKTLWDGKELNNQVATQEVKALLGGDYMSFPKSMAYIKSILQLGSNSDSLIIDFFSGSATTAHAVMKLNAEDGGKRKFIMVQLPEPCDEKSEAAKAGYKNICEIGKERIRRAGKKILEEVAAKNAMATKERAQGELELGGNAINAVNPVTARVDARPPDVGFRVLKLDTSNMEEVYYSPKTFAEKAMQGTLNLDGDASLAENIKQGRTGEDLLFQSMLRLDVPLSAKIETGEIHGKRVFVVDDGYMMATFDKDVNEETIKAIAKRAPSIFVMCDGGFATDNVADNFEQIWKAFSPDTVRRVI